MSLSTSLSDPTPFHTLKFLTAGSVDDGKSTLIGRLLLDSKAILADQLSGIQHHFSEKDSYDLARLTDGLQAEREQGITIDVAYRYFTTPKRKFIIADAPGHEQYTRNMVTAASSSDAVVILVDATKLDWKSGKPELLPQTRRHTLLANLLRVPSILFAINKLDAIADSDIAFLTIKQALKNFMQEADIQASHIIPISALKGFNITTTEPDSSGYRLCERCYHGPSLLEALTELPSQHYSEKTDFYFPVQYVQKLPESATASTQHGQRIFWGKIAAGTLRPKDAVTIHPSGIQVKVARILTDASQLGSTLAETPHVSSAHAGQSVGLVLDQEMDISRGDWLTAPHVPAFKKEIQATLSWLDEDPLVVGRPYWLKQGHRWIKAKVSKISHQLDIQTLKQEPASELRKNAIGQVSLILQQGIPTVPYKEVKEIGSAILVDTTSNRTAGALLIES